MPVFIEAPCITVAGQTAPGDGICIADEGLVVDAHNVVIRYVRSRRGNLDIFDHHGNPLGNIMVDHVSAYWGVNQNIDTYRHRYTPPGVVCAPSATKPGPDASLDSHPPTRRRKPPPLRCGRIQMKARRRSLPRRAES